MSRSLLIAFILVLFPASLFAVPTRIEMNMNNDVTQSRKQMILSIVGSRLMDFSIDSLLVKLDKNQKEPRGKTQ